MKKITLLFLISLLSILSCDKDDPVTTISGQATTFGTENSIVDAKVILYGGTSNGNFSNPGADLKRIDSTYTDVTGFYEFIFDASPYPALDLVAEKDFYFSKGINQGLIHGTNVVDLVMDPFAWVKFHVKNISPGENEDAVYINGLNAPNISESGADVDVIKVMPLSGNKEHLIVWQVHKNGNVTDYNESIYFSAQDTTLFEIFY